MEVPLSVLDLVQVPSGAGPADALRRTIDLAQRAEALGYVRYWLAEHHLNPGVAGTSPPLVMAMVAGATERIRVGSGGMQMGHRTPLSVVEEFGLLDAVHPHRLDLGMGRSGGRNFLADRSNGGSARRSPSGAGEGQRRRSGGAPPPPGAAPASRVVDGVVIPAKFSLADLARAPRFRTSAALLQQPGAETPPYGDQVRQVLALLESGYRSPEGVVVHAVPGEGASVEVWVLGSSAGDSAVAAGELGLRFAANYHVSPATVLEAVQGYRRAFRPSRALDRPYVLVSADVVVAEDEAAARRLAAGYGLWVRSIRSGEGAIPYPGPEEAAGHRWTAEDRRLVADRVETQFVGDPHTVVDRLEALRLATGADELIVTTMTHDHADRVRSYELLAEAWRQRAHPPVPPVRPPRPPAQPPRPPTTH